MVSKSMQTRWFLIRSSNKLNSGEEGVGIRCFTSQRGCSSPYQEDANACMCVFLDLKQLLFGCAILNFGTRRSCEHTCHTCKFQETRTCSPHMTPHLCSFSYPDNTPRTKEAYWYRSIFEQHFPQRSAVETVPGGPSVACSTPTAAL